MQESIVFDVHHWNNDRFDVETTRRVPPEARFPQDSDVKTHSFCLMCFALSLERDSSLIGEECLSQWIKKSKVESRAVWSPPKYTEDTHLAWNDETGSSSSSLSRRLKRTKRNACNFVRVCGQTFLKDSSSPSLACTSSSHPHNFV